MTKKLAGMLLVMFGLTLAAAAQGPETSAREAAQASKEAAKSAIADKAMVKQEAKEAAKAAAVEAKKAAKLAGKLAGQEAAVKAGKVAAWSDDWNAAKHFALADAELVLHDLREKFKLKEHWAEMGAWSVLAGHPQQPKLTEEEELKMYALNAMRNANPEEAIPLLDKFLQGNHAMPLKDRALSVLSSYETAQARAVLTRYAKDASNPELQLRALRYLGRVDSSEARKTLAEIYPTMQNKEARKAVLRGFQSADDTARLFAAARSETDLEVRSYAARQLGSMGARAELRQLYDAETTPEGKGQIIRALATADDVDKLSEIARKDPDPTVRREAIRRLTSIEAAQTSELLVALYGNEKETEVRKEVLSSLARREDARNLVALARKETNPELKKYAVTLLTRMRSKDAQDYLVELLK